MSADLKLEATADGHALFVVERFRGTNYLAGRDLDMSTDAGITVVLSREMLGSIVAILAHRNGGMSMTVQELINALESA